MKKFFACLFLTACGINFGTLDKNSALWKEHCYPFQTSATVHPYSCSNVVIWKCDDGKDYIQRTIAANSDRIDTVCGHVDDHYYFFSCALDDNRKAVVVCQE